MTLKYATVCSGIGAPEQAWSDIWGAPVFVSEIDKFPSAVLAHHYPDVPNLGDMTQYKEWPDYDIELICGGTPCQSFSVAGLRKGMDDPRGNLTLTFLGILARYNSRWFVWENVPGVFSSISDGGSDFGRFLSALAELGYSCAYRVLDAQHFGVPQRRRRVFVVGYLGDDWRPPFAVLFEPESLRGNTPKGRNKREGVAGCFEVGPGGNRECKVVPTLDSRCKDGPIRNQVGAMVMAHGQGNAEIVKDGSPSLTCNHEAPILYEHHMQDSRVKEVNVCPSLSAKAGTGGGNLPIAIHAHCIGRKDEAGPQAKPYRTDGKGYTHDARGVPQAVAVRTAQTNANGHGVSENRAHTLDGAQGQCVAFSGRNRGPEPKVNRLERPPHTMIELTGALETVKPWNISHDSVVRRLTPMECERLQGFPDGYTQVSYRGKPAADGPRYKALGNSMAVPVVRRIGEHIQIWEELQMEAHV